MIQLRARNIEDTRQIARALAKLLRARDMVVLAGDMGAGKTAFVSAAADALGVGGDEHVSSPTFTLVHTYTSGKLPIHHADLYRLELAGEVEDLGLREQADMGAVVFVEWGNVAVDLLGECLEITFEHDDEDDDARHINIDVVGHGWDTRWDHLRSATQAWVA